MQIEFDILHWIHDNLTRSDFISFLMRIFTFINDKGIVWIITCIVLLSIKKTRRGGVLLSLALAIGFILNSTLKLTIQRTRPIYSEGQESLLDFASKWLTTSKPLSYLVGIPERTSYSFASGHTFSSFNCATIIYYLNKKWGIGAYILASLIAFSRLYFAVHFPTDVIVGLVLGIVTARTCICAYKLINIKKERFSLCV